jgi:hypothetical protein
MVSERIVFDRICLLFFIILNKDLSTVGDVRPKVFGFALCSGLLVCLVDLGSTMKMSPPPLLCIYKLGFYNVLALF